MRITITSIAIIFVCLACATSPADASSATAVCAQIPTQGTITGHLSGSGMNVANITNHSQTCAYKVGIASYKAYLPYTNDPNNKDWIFTQTYYASRTTTLQPGQSWTYTISVPGCAYQTDVYWGDTLPAFPNLNTTYSGQGRYLDGWYETSLPVCAHPTTTPTPTPTTTPMSSPSPTPPVKLPTTGPGDTVAMSLAGSLAGLVMKKFWLGR